MKPKPIDLEKIEQRNNEIFELFKQKIELIKQLDGKYNDLFEKLELYNLNIEAFILRLCINQKNTSPLIPVNNMILKTFFYNKDLIYKNMFKNYEYDSKINNLKRIDYLKDWYFTRKSIEKGYPVSNPGNDPEYVEILREELKALTSYRDEDLYEDICRQIRLFYVKDAIETRTMKPKKQYTKAESDARIDEKIREYKYLIKLLERKKELLTEKLNTLEGIEKIDTEIEIIKLKIQIESKTGFMDMYKERKEILP